tara:strand:- start:142 stop:1311 length:1170 start_codon:yes stop_codon:yes gene_type:complete
MAGRTYYASQAVGIHPRGHLSETANFTNGSTISTVNGVAYKQRILDGVQSVGFSSNVEFEQIFELGHLQIFENIEGSPSCEATLERALPVQSPSLLEIFGASGNDYGVNMSNLGNDVGLSIRLGVNADGGVMTNIASTSANRYGIQIDGFTSSYSISAQTDGAVTESLGIAGVNLFVIPSGATTNLKLPQPSTSNPSGVFRRQDTSVVKRAIKADNTVDALATNNVYDRVQSASISVDIGREDLLEMGRKGPYIRYASFPVEVTAEVEYAVDTTKEAGDHVMQVNGLMTRITADTECDITAGKGSLLEIRGTRRLGSTCQSAGTNAHKKLNTGLGVAPSFAVGISGAKLQSQNWSGGDTGGGVVTISESYTSFNNIRGTTNSDGASKPL